MVNDPETIYVPPIDPAEDDSDAITDEPEVLVVPEIDAEPFSIVHD